MTQPATAFSPAVALPSGFGINLFGQLSSSTGLGVAARHTVKSLVAAGVPVKCFDLAPFYPTFIGDAELTEFEPYLETDPERLIYPVNLYFLPPFELPRLIQQAPWLESIPRYHTGVVWWETTKLHPTWTDALSRFDAVVAYSPFIASVMANCLELTPVLAGMQPLFLEDRIQADRSAFELPLSSTVFLASFDPSSDPARKNPTATIDAFRAAFPAGTEDVRLVFRLNNADSSPLARETCADLFAVARGDRRVGFAAGPMSYRQVLSLYASSDVYVSLHRAEGLGLGMLEAMRLGIPVIATAWSGNMAFMDHLSACLVRYRLIPVSGNHPFYSREVLGPDAVWADPVIEDAAVWMSHLHKHPTERRRVGEAGRRKAEDYQQGAMALHWVSELARLWSDASFLPVVHGKLSSRRATS